MQVATVDTAPLLKTHIAAAAAARRLMII